MVRLVRYVYHLHFIWIEKIHALKSFLLQKDVDTAIHYLEPVHPLPIYSYLGYKRGDFSLAEKWANDILSLPMFAGLREDEIGYVANMMRTFSNAGF
jgi:dTDP-4-amino-4,6-dideoxygalactose transaminase